MLTPEQQRFVRLYCVCIQDTARALLGILDDPHRGGGLGPRRPSFDYDTEGIGWTWPHENVGHTEWGRPRSHAHRITWAEIAAHGRQQPAHLRDQLTEIVSAHADELRRHDAALDEINETGYSHATDEQRHALDAEYARHHPIWREQVDRMHQLTDSMLSDGIDEPADLIEWAEALA